MCLFLRPNLSSFKLLSYHFAPHNLCWLTEQIPNKQTYKKHWIPKASQTISLLVLFTSLDGPHLYPWCPLGWNLSHWLGSVQCYKVWQLLATSKTSRPNGTNVLQTCFTNWSEWRETGQSLTVPQICRNFFVFIWSIVWEPESCGNYSPTCCV